jgi:hypothetical protein
MKLSSFDLNWYNQWQTRRTFMEECSRPGLTNFLGTVQVGNDVTSLRHPVFPPVSGCEESTAYLTVNNTFLPATRLLTSTRWTPWAIEREVEVEGLTIITRTSMPIGKPGIVMEIHLQSKVAAEHEIALRTSGRCVNRGLDRWFWGIPQVGLTVTDLHDQGGMNPFIEKLSPSFRIWQERPNPDLSDHCGKAWCAQAVNPPSAHLRPNGDMAWKLSFAAGETKTLRYALLMGESRESVLEAKEMAAQASELLAATEAYWRQLWKEIFTGGPTFSGKLPDLDLPEELLPVAASAIFSVVYLRKQHAPNKGKIRYSISMPRRVEACFYPNDWGMAATILTRLDPTPTWEQLEIALVADLRKYNQINTFTNKGGDYNGHGWPYTVDILNAFVVTRGLMQNQGPDFLEKTINTVNGSQTILETLEDLALDYRKRLLPEWGLADYGPRQLLLECVSTYEHMVASINAGAIWMLRELAAIYEGKGWGEKAFALQEEANALQSALLKHLYVEGKGWFRSISPDGTARECRHCWDTGMVLHFIGDTLPRNVCDEMVHFFVSELQTPGWIRALSPHDADAAVSGVRADHQYNGAFSSWPAYVLLGLINIGRSDLAREWLGGIARTARQGPFGQGYVDENVVEPVNGGAAKVTDELPQCCHWCNISGGMFFNALEKLC